MPVEEATATLSTVGLTTEEGRATLAAVRALDPMIRAAQADIEDGGKLTAEVVDGLREAGVWRMTMPRAWGGSELDLTEQFYVLEALSVADGSTGWCAYIGSTAGYWTSYIDQDVARALYPSVDLPTGGSPAPVGKAVIDGDGYRVTGRWPFGSGCDHNVFMVSGAIVHDENGPVLDANGQTQAIVCFLPMAECTIVGNWDPVGLRGTGSSDYTAEDLYVPKSHTFAFANPAVLRDGPLYAFDGAFLFNHAAVVLGMARAAIDEFRHIAETKRSSRGTPIKDEEHARIALAECEAELAAGRAYALDMLREVWEVLESGETPSLDLRARYRLCLHHVHRLSTAIVDRAYHAAGSGAIKSGSRLDRCFRDAHTGNQHMVASDYVLSECGSMLFGNQPVDPSF